MITLNEKQISEIADSLDAGMNCYFNIKSGVIKTIIDFDSWIGADEEPWKKDIKEIEENFEEYIAFDRMNTNQSFELMADFADSLDNENIRRKLVTALNKSKPFRNFKWAIDNSGEYQNQWFEFKKNRYIEFVKEQIEAYNLNKNNEQ
jgi:hypothetical protein